MTPFQLITSRLERASQPRASRDGTTIRACCPACGGKNRSKLVITEKPDGFVLIHCFEGCGVEQIVDALNINIADLFPEPLKRSSRRAQKGRPHDPFFLVGFAIEAIEETEFLLLRHAAQPLPDIGARLIQQIGLLSDIRANLVKEVANG